MCVVWSPSAWCLIPHSSVLGHQSGLHPDLDPGHDSLKSILHSMFCGEWWLGLFIWRPCPSHSHVAHVGHSRERQDGEAEPRLGWECLVLSIGQCLGVLQMMCMCLG